MLRDTPENSFKMLYCLIVGLADGGDKAFFESPSQTPRMAVTMDTGSLSVEGTTTVVESLAI